MNNRNAFLRILPFVSPDLVVPSGEPPNDGEECYAWLLGYGADGFKRKKEGAKEKKEKPKETKEHDDNNEDTEAAGEAKKKKKNKNKKKNKKKK
jgi:hypothetical protein